jgi:hypothetical protein
MTVLFPKYQLPLMFYVLINITVILFHEQFSLLCDPHGNDIYLTTSCYVIQIRVTIIVINRSTSNGAINVLKFCNLNIYIITILQEKITRTILW